MPLVLVLLVIAVLPVASFADFVDNGERPGNLSARGVALADLDGDGAIDAFVVNGGAGLPDPAAVWWNDGSAVFSVGPQLGSELGRAVDLADLDGDGDIDAFVAAEAGGRIWLNQGAQGNEREFVDGGLVATGAIEDIALGNLDADLDGDVDAVVATQNGGLAQVWWNDGSANFSAGPILGAGPPHGAGVAIGTLDAGASLDIVAVGDLADGFGTIAVVPYTYDGAGVFTPGVAVEVDSLARRVSLGDLDQDLDFDAVVAQSASSTILWNDGGVLSLGPGLLTPNAQEIAIDDLDADGDQDLFVANGIAVSQDPDQVFEQTAPGVFEDTGQALGTTLSTGVALADLDGQAGPDAFVAGAGENRVWLDGGAGPPPEVFSWQVETLDVRGWAGLGASIAVDASGHPHIGYLTADTASAELRYATWDGIDWSFEVLDRASNFDALTQISLTPAGIPVVAWRGETVIDPMGTIAPRIHRFTRSEGEPWLRESLTCLLVCRRVLSLLHDPLGTAHLLSLSDAAGALLNYHDDSSGSTNPNSYNAAGDLALDPTGQPWIAAVGGVGGESLAVFTPRAPPGSEEVVESGDVGQIVSFRISPDGRFHVSYYDTATQSLRYATRNGGAWSTETIVDGGVGVWNSLDLAPDGTIWIAYQDGGSLSIARGGPGAWSTQVIDSDAGVGPYVSLAVDLDGIPHVAYQDSAFDDLRYATPNPDWSFTTVHSGGERPSLVTREGVPRIAFEEVAEGRIALRSWDQGAWVLARPSGQDRESIRPSFVAGSFSPILGFQTDRRLFAARPDSFRSTRIPRATVAGLEPGASLFIRSERPAFAFVSANRPRLFWENDDYEWIDEEGLPEQPATTIEGAWIATRDEMVIAYADPASGRLTVATRDPLTGTWEAVEVTTLSGEYHGLAVGRVSEGSEPAVAWFQPSTGTVHYAREGDGWRPLQIATASGPVTSFSLSLDQVLRPFVAYTVEGESGFWLAHRGEIGFTRVRVDDPEGGLVSAVSLHVEGSPRVAYQRGQGASAEIVYAAPSRRDSTPVAGHQGSNIGQMLPSLCAPNEKQGVSRVVARSSSGDLSDVVVVSRFAQATAQTLEGQQWIALYSEHASELHELIMVDPALVWDGYRTVQNAMPGLEALVTGDGDRIVVTQRLADQYLDLWQRLAAIASPGLAGDINTALSTYNDLQDFVGMTFSEWAAAVGIAGLPAEICGNCLDDDGNGLVDFEEPMCCGLSGPDRLELRKVKLQDRGATTKVSLKATLGLLGPTLEGDPSDVYLQIRAATSEMAYCAQIPAESIRVKDAKRKASWTFKDKKGLVAEAMGMDGVKLKRKKLGKNTSVAVRVKAKDGQLPLPPVGDLNLVLSFRNPDDAEGANRCFEAEETFRERKSGSLQFP